MIFRIQPVVSLKTAVVNDAADGLGATFCPRGPVGFGQP